MTGPESDNSGEINPQELAFEDALGELEALIDRIEQGEIGLEASLAAHRRGVALIRRCRSILDGAQQELETITPEDGDGDGDD